MEQETAQDYFESVYRETFRQVSRYVLFKSPGPAEAEDVVASVYTDFYQYVALRGRRPANIQAYLLRMAGHELSRLYSKRQHTVSFDDDDLNLRESVPDDVDLELAVFDKFASDELWAAVGRLGKTQQQVLVARFRFDMTFPEIANELGQGESAVKLRFYRAIKKLREILLQM